MMEPRKHVPSSNDAITPFPLSLNATSSRFFPYYAVVAVRIRHQLDRAGKRSDSPAYLNVDALSAQRAHPTPRDPQSPLERHFREELSGVAVDYRIIAAFVDRDCGVASNHP